MDAGRFHRRHDRALGLRLARLLRRMARHRRMDRRRAASRPSGAKRSGMTASDRSAPRSAGILLSRRSRLPWPADREFRILSIDGGGIRGIFPAAVLAGLEERFLGGNSVAGYFDLIAGTSTGGILALGLGAGLTAAELLELYVERGCEIFPPLGTGLIGRLRRRWRARRDMSATSTTKARSPACCRRCCRTGRSDRLNGGFAYRPSRASTVRFTFSRRRTIPISSSIGASRCSR
jgi:Patatin-like phospholipase